MIEIELPWPPSVNHYWRHWRGRAVISGEGRNYRTVVGMLAGACAPFAADARLSVTLRCSPPDRRRRDLDNLPKALLDALQHAGLYADDAQIDRLLIERGGVVPLGRVRVQVQAMGGAC